MIPLSPEKKSCPATGFTVLPVFFCFIFGLQDNFASSVEPQLLALELC